MSASPKLKCCRACGTMFEPWRFAQVACSPLCGIEVAKDNTRRKLARAKREARIAMRRRRDWVKIAQELVNRWIKLRDVNDGCISCHMPANYGGQWHASHYRSVGAAPQLRFDPANIHKSCAQCNGFKSGNVVEYRIRLIQKIGLAEVERLESDNRIHRHTVEELQAVIATYRAKLRELRKGRAA